MNVKRCRGVLVFLAIFILVSVAFIPMNTSARLKDIWKKTYGGPSDDVATSHIFTDDGGILVVGYTRSFGEGKLNNIFIVKTNKNGYTQWRKTYGGTFDDEGSEVIKTSDGGYAIAGSSESYKGKAQYDFYLLKTDSKGNKQWDTGFGGRYAERCYSLIETEDGGYLMAGSTITYGARGSDYWVVKTDEEGNMLWNETYGGDGDDICRSVIKTRDGDYLLAGYTDSFGDPGQGAYLVKINETGSTLWTRTSGGIYDDYVHDVIRAEGGGGFVFVGSTTSYGAGEESFWMTKTDSEGHEEWNYSSDGDYDEIAYSVEQSENGNFLMTGFTSSYGDGGKDFWIVEINKEGKEVSKNAFGSGDDEVAYSIAIDEKNDIAIAGFTESYGAGGRDFWVVKLGRPERIPLLWVIGGVIGTAATVVAIYKINKRYRLV